MGVKVTFDFATGQIVVEGTEGDLIKIAQEMKALAPKLSEIRILTDSAKRSPEHKDQPDRSQPGRKSSIREFAKSLPLGNTYERIAALAYHAIKIQEKPYFSVKEMDAWFGLCGFKKPKNLSVGLSDARRRYDYVDSRGRDQWTVTTGGENVIMEMMERQKA